MKQVFAILLTISFLLPFLSKVGIVVNFKVNQDFIAEVFCVNKDEPEKQCNGKCFLAQQLKAAEESDQNKSRTAFEELPELEVIPIEDVRTYVVNDNFLKNSNIEFISSFSSSDFINRLYRPPQVF